MYEDELRDKQRPEPSHEHSFTIQTENHPYTQQSTTLRICRTCGLTHVLHKDEFEKRFYWMFVGVELHITAGTAIKGLKT